MTEHLTIPLNQDNIFLYHARDMGIVVFCIEEREESNRYEVMFESPMDLFYLGQRTAIEFDYQQRMKSKDE